MTSGSAIWLLRSALLLGAAIASYRLLAHRRNATGDPAQLIESASRVSTFLLLGDTLLLPIVLTAQAGFGRRVALFALAALLADATLRWSALCLSALSLSALIVVGDVALRSLIAAGVPGLAINPRRTPKTGH